MAFIDEYSIDELKHIVGISKSYRDLAKNLGYRSFSSAVKELISKRIINYNLDISHFNKDKKLTTRCVENIFIKNSTADQSTLRKWYLKEEFSPYICSICGQLPFWNGKEMSLILDHINGENHDNRFENLRWVCPNCNQQLDTTSGKNHKKLKKKYYCIDCGVEICRGSTRCNSCQNKNKTKLLDDMPVTRDELKFLVRNNSFTNVGKLFKVADNTIRKWCDKFEIPRNKSIIQQISDEEWALI